MKRTQYQTQTVLIPAGTLAGFYELPPFEMNPNYSKVSGIKMVEVYNLQNFIHRISLRDTADVFIDMVSALFLKSNYSIINNVEFTPCNIKAAGNKITVLVNITSNLAADYKFDIIYRMTDEAVENKPRIKYQTETITIPLGATFLETILTMNLEYKRVTGIAMTLYSGLSGANAVRLTISDNAGEFMTSVYQDELIITHFEEASKRFVETDLMALGNKVIVKTLPVVAPIGASGTFDLIFRLEMA